MAVGNLLGDPSSALDGRLLVVNLERYRGSVLAGVRVGDRKLEPFERALAVSLFVTGKAEGGGDLDAASVCVFLSCGDGRMRGDEG